MFLLRKKTVALPAIEIHYEMDGREITLEKSFIPEEKETLEAIRDCLQHVFWKFETCLHRDPVEICVRGDHMDYFFEARVCCREVKDRVEMVFEELNRVLTMI